MVAVKLFRTVGALQEEYGQVRYDGQRFYYDGLSTVFIKYLQRGIIGRDRQCYRPEHGIKFLQSLKNHFTDNILQATDILQEC